MATYVNDLRLKEIATGDESGTWGASTNTNLELIAEAFSFGTEAITTNADTHTTTIADGSTDPGRSLFLKYTGTLDSACTITIGPNTVSKLWLIENATSGSQNIIIKQGSGATVTIANGQTKAIYSDGAGSGGAMVDAFQDLSIPDLFIDDDLTFTSDSAVITFGADGDTTLTHTDGSGLTLNSTNKLMFNDASQFIQGSSATVLSLGATDEIDLTATAIDINGTADISSTLTVGGATRINADFSVTAASGEDRFAILPQSAGSGTILFSGNSDLSAYEPLVVDFENLNLRTSGTARFTITATDTVINDNSNDHDFRVESNGNTHMLFVDGGNDAVGIGVSDVADAQLVIRSTGVDGTYNNVLSAQYSGNSNEHNVIGTSVSSTAANSGFIFKASDGGGSTGTTEVLKLTRAGAIFNDASGDQDFRVESDNTTHMLFVDAGNDHVNIGGSADSGGMLNVSGDIVLSVGSGNPSFTLKTAGTGNNPHVNYRAGDNIVFDNMLVASASTDYWRVGFGTSGSVATEVLAVTTDAKVGINTTTIDAEADALHVVSSGTNTVLIDGTGSHELYSYHDSGGVGWATGPDSSYGELLYLDEGSSRVIIYAGGNATTFFTSAETVVNEGSRDHDFRVESDNSTHAFFIDGANGSAGFGTSLNSDLHGSATNILLGRAGSLYAERSSALGIPVTAIGYNFYIDSDTGNYAARITSAGTNLAMGAGTFSFNTAASVSAGAAITYVSRMNIGTSSVVINESGADNDFRVESDALSHCFFIDAGNSTVGVGTSAPDNRLHVVDSTSGAIAPLVIGNENNASATTQKVRLGFGLSRDSGTVKNDAGEIEVGKDNQWDATDNNVDSYMAFRTYTNNSVTEKMRVTSAGSLLLGHTAAVASHVEKLGIDCDQAGGFGIFLSGDASTGGSSNVTAVRFFDSGSSAGLVGSIVFNDTSTAFNTSSDYRLKENVTDLTNATDRLKQLEPKRFNFKSNADKTVDGFLAHEVSSIVPEAITGEKDAVDDKGEPVYQGIDQSKLVPLLVATIQELEARITALEGE